MTDPPFSLHDHVTAAETSDGMVLLDRRTGRYWQLNTTAALILRALLDGTSREKAALFLTDRHPSAADRAAADVAALVRALRDAGLTAGE
ncbi:lasso peptide biosynthesis PqqD family chaperone [Streptomyces sp. NPDC003077]|uniref:lasso peptide biosynthesis PqqD family chaperone n=1 Tax=Streptomyces sp. NPDC003077 TaxID=3154443 RepID=UPI00339E5FD8